MKIFSAKQLYQAEEITQKNQKIDGIQLMERAGTSAFEQIHARLGKAAVQIKVFCGVGNNGGDGLVIARKLIEKGYAVQVFIINYSEQRTAGFLSNYNAIKELLNKWPVMVNEESELPTVQANDVVIDAIFGIGLNRPLASWVNKVITHINDAGAYTFAIDVPSGMQLDSYNSKQPILRANYTLTFQVAKLPFFLPETAPYAGNIQIIDIGLDQQFLHNQKAVATLITKEQAAALYQPRSRFSHKGDYGHAYVIGGKYGMIGSVILATKAALRMGAGKVSAVVPTCAYIPLQTVNPEVMVKTVAHDEYLVEDNFEFSSKDRICFGVGAGQEEKSIEMFTTLLHQVKTPIVIDADGINMLGKAPELLKLIPEKSILTPHPKELLNLIGEWNDDFDKINKVKDFSKKYRVSVVIKGTYTLTVSGEHVYINTNGNPGMATAGSGDVLSGILVGLLAQGYDPAISCVFGVYIHALAGDLAIQNTIPDALLASDIIAHQGKALRYLFEKPQEVKNSK